MEIVWLHALTCHNTSCLQSNYSLCFESASAVQMLTQRNFIKKHRQTEGMMYYDMSVHPVCCVNTETEITTEAETERSTAMQLGIDGMRILCSLYIATCQREHLYIHVATCQREYPYM